MASNPAPHTILNKRLIFAAVNSANGANVLEPFRVYGPYAQGVRITKLRTGNKAVIPLTPETGENSYFLKLHFPNTSSIDPIVNQAMYITFCKKNHLYDDGYSDFVTRVPNAYIVALKSWIDNGLAPSTSGVIRYRKLSFTAYGEETAQINQAIPFEIRFNYRGAQVGVTQTTYTSNETVGFNQGTLTTGNSNNGGNTNNFAR